ncbi:ABC transporter permease [Achromobacter xylosoxidans]|uniref:Dipeptide transport system permease protein DppC n=2 Tax=Achromobacter TaxID=222 RepID=A0A2M9GZX3_9BURK|nr:ABC transporter permease [Achromobacter ruhlandii]AMG45974.1 ABC transporter permease [Achromobacter xylosoxidans]ODA01377.1 ABC transporter permease [Achromobacter xylosoxidans]PJM70102.1 ABC transporter permease [Achromobacter ruhlandii]CAB3886510.1 Dipeptide transport system permease protein DppC [Achromobacter ruhlandii]CAB3925312.1 Dipeptide transport system permease protein DppC [Achromobacter ruhlandii]
MTAHSASAPAPAAAPSPTRRGALGQLLGNPAAVAGALLLLFILLAALAAPWLFPHDPLDMVGPPILWPGQDPGFWLGTDTMGRDVAAGLAHGARVSLTVGVTAALLSLLIGIAVGAAAGYFGGWVDVALMRVTELLQTIPAFLLVVVIVAIARPSVTVIALSIGVASWPVVARLVRAEFRTLRESEFVQAARTLGYGHARIALLEILPNALPPVIVTTSVLVANAILMESALSFMNMGDPNAVSWGSMIGDAREMLRTAWYLAALPGVSIILTVLSLNLLGDALNDAFNPRLSR